MNRPSIRAREHSAVQIRVSGVPEGGPRAGVGVRLRRRKTDQEGQVRRIGISRASKPRRYPGSPEPWL
jgi:hypothetical protein